MTLLKLLLLVAINASHDRSEAHGRWLCLVWNIMKIILKKIFEQYLKHCMPDVWYSWHIIKAIIMNIFKLLKFNHFKTCCEILSKKFAGWEMFKKHFENTFFKLFFDNQNITYFNMLSKCYITICFNWSVLKMLTQCFVQIIFFTTKI